MTFMVVVLPAPLGPSRPKMSPVSMARDRLWMATFTLFRGRHWLPPSYTLRSSCTYTTGGCCPLTLGMRLTSMSATRRRSFLTSSSSFSGRSELGVMSMMRLVIQKASATRPPALAMSAMRSRK
ncbi:unnamed protein product [Ixodes persulcatus]